MPNGNPEQKDIARLNFNIKDALDSLNSVNKKLEEIAKSSKTYADTISKNLNKSFDAGKMINTQEIKAESDKVVKTLKLNTDKILQNDKVYIRNSTLQHEKGVEDRLTASHKAMLKEEEYNRRIAKSTESLYDKITQYAKTYVIYQGFNELRKGISETIDEMVEVEQQMVAIDRVMNITGMDVNAFRDDLIQLAYDYGNSFNNVADVSLRLAQAGVKGENNLKLTEKTLLALNTAELDATQATDDMVAVMSQWNLITDDATKTAESYGNIIDKVNKVADNFPTTSEDILEALKKTSSAFNLAGASIDETIATIVAAEKASQRGGKVIGTALSNITQQLKAEGKINLAEELGLDFFKDADKTEFKGIMEIFQEMAERMQQLKEEGKENSVEMQNLLELFTVFRRNVGASLLGEMSGEDNTYLDVLKTSMDSVGYSLQENEKYMKTAKAAQEQFNNELLKLKTEVWDNQLESVFRDMLSFGKDFVEGLTKLIDKVGILPTTVATATAAFSLFGKKIDANSLKKYGASIKETRIALQLYNDTVGKGEITSKEFANIMGKDIPNSVKNYTKSLDGAKASMVGLTVKTVTQIAKEVALNLVIAATEAAISMGLSVAITALVGVIDNWIRAEEKAIEKNKEILQKSQESAEKIKTEREERQKLTKELEENINKYNELDKSNPERTEITAKLYELQNQINEALEGTGKQVNVINESLDEQGKTVVSINDEWEKQIRLLNQISYQEKIKEIEKLQTAMESANENLKGITFSWQDKFLDKKESQLKKALEMSELNLESFIKDVGQATGTRQGMEKLAGFNIFDLQELDFEKQAYYLNEWVNALRNAKNQGEDVGDALTFFREKLEELEVQQETATKATEAYNKALYELAESRNAISNLTDNLLDISEAYDDKNAKELINDIISINKQYTEGKIEAEKYFDSIQEQIKKIDFKGMAEEITNLQNEYKKVRLDGTNSIEDIRQKQAELTNEINKSKLKLEEYQRIFTEVASATAASIADIINSYNSGSIKFTEYSRNMKESAETTLGLYTQINELTYDSEKGWINSKKEVDEYANSLQEAKAGLDALDEAINVFDKYWETFKQYETATGEILVKQEAITTEMVIDTANAMNKILNSSSQVSEGVIKNIEEITGKTRDTFIETNNMMGETVKNINEEFLKSEEGFNATQNAMKNQAQGTVQSIAQATGNLLNALAESINNFNFSISIKPVVNPLAAIANLLGIPTSIPAITFKITGERTTRSC